MSAVLEWLKTFLMLYFFLTLILYLVPKKSYQKYLQFAVKMILLVVVFLPLLNRVSSGVDFFYPDDTLLHNMGLFSRLIAINDLHNFL